MYHRCLHTAGVCAVHLQAYNGCLSVRLLNSQVVWHRIIQFYNFGPMVDCVSVARHKPKQTHGRHCTRLHGIMDRWNYIRGSPAIAMFCTRDIYSPSIVYIFQLNIISQNVSDAQTRDLNYKIQFRDTFIMH